MRYLLGVIFLFTSWSLAAQDDCGTEENPCELNLEIILAITPDLIFSELSAERINDGSIGISAKIKNDGQRAVQLEPFPSPGNVVIQFYKLNITAGPGFPPLVTSTEPAGGYSLISGQPRILKPGDTLSITSSASYSANFKYIFAEIKGVSIPDGDLANNYAIVPIQDFR